MQIDELRDDGALQIEDYGPGFITVDGTVFRDVVCLDGNTALPAAVSVPADLSANDLETAAAAYPEVVLVGTGSRQEFLHPRLAALLAAKGIGLECMNTAAACRTYLILRGEGRRVYAWIWPEAG